MLVATFKWPKAKSVFVILLAFVAGLEACLVRDITAGADIVFSVISVTQVRNRDLLIC